MAIFNTQIFQQAIYDLNRMGILDVVLPFFLIFILVYSVLRKTAILGGHYEPKTLGEGDNARTVQIYKADAQTKRMNLVVALIIGIIFVSPHVLYNSYYGDGVLDGPFAGFPDPVEVINKSIPTIAIWLVVMLMFMVLTGMIQGFTGSEATDNFLIKIFENHTGKIAGAAAAIIIYVFGVSAGWWPNIRLALGNFRQPLIDGATAMFILILLSIALIVWYVGKDDNP